jgi:hypothetical protein
VSETASAPTDLDLISFLQAIPDARMRRGVRIPAWYLLLVAVLGILSRCQSLRALLSGDNEFGRLYSAALGVAISQACYATGENHERAVLKQPLDELDLEGVLIQADALHTQRPFFDSSRSRGPTSS